jgi:hypothetical protein
MSSSGGSINAQITGSLPAGTNTIGNVRRYPHPQIVDSAASSARTVSGQGTSFSTTSITEVGVDINITAVSGTSPTITFVLGHYGADGIFYPSWTSSSITSAQKVSAAVGSGMANANSLGENMFLQWTIGGTTPSFTFSYSIIGR